MSPPTYYLSLNFTAVSSLSTPSTVSYALNLEQILGFLLSPVH